MAGRLSRSTATETIYRELRNSGVAQLDAAALLYALGVSIDELTIAMLHYGDVSESDVRSPA